MAAARLAECAAALAEAEGELAAALVTRERARQSRARVAVLRLRKRRDWLLPRARLDDGDAEHEREDSASPER